MTTLTRPRSPGRLFDARSRGGHAPGRRPTLEERLGGAWREASSTGAAACPVCGGSMKHTGRSADCADCGSRLA